MLVLAYLGVLIYVIARGGRMQERRTERAARAEQLVANAIRQVAPPNSTADELLRLTQLRAQGILSANQFGAQKTKLLA